MNIASSVAKLLLVASCFAVWAADTRTLPVGYCQWTAVQFEIREPLCAMEGDARRGREIAADTHLGNCIACHQMPIPERDFHGSLGPPLHNVAARYTEAQLRMRIVDERQINPATVMPGFYADPRRANRVMDEYWDKTILGAQQVEDVIAYLKTLN